ncbi:O-antigen polymerase [Thermoanaerobacterium xylanolyticum LX-11]|uniref:O-antigen polymerase n=1 Tax=Thermoanaerobacterium xylanolyticum (strain ATCC 49914 / DSM 7097 / LX-11) TaxID=858215 RepID=F6BIT5_THEXL|nr:O-antigen ligase family protein [Thermoanaerobacterium xylanolyticum]AEF17820.1 O-antigen polymerase [Thermoanaerobacterium xylanolyticum LX-11]
MNTLLTINKQRKRISISILMILTIIVYILFAFKRIKFSFASKIDDIPLNNEVWLFPIILIFKYLIIKKERLFDKNLIILYCGLIIDILIGGFNMDSPAQYIYAILQLMVPMFFIFSITKNDLLYIDLFIKLSIMFCLVYSLLAIVTSRNYGLFLEILGDRIKYQYLSQYRASLMLGSSITVSYYLNMMLPLCFYFYYTTTENKWKILSFITIILNFIATLVLLSRLSFFISIFVMVYYLLFSRSNNLTRLKRIEIIILAIGVGIYSSKIFNLSRLFIGFNDESTLERLKAINLGIYLFIQYPILGTGLGRYFTRVYSNRNILVDGIQGLVDPHNTYVMVLSEMGIIGFIILTMIFISIISKFKYIEDTILRKTAYMTVIVYILGAFGGSQLLNEISYSTLLWIYFSLFRAVSIRDYSYKKSNSKLKQ